MSETSKLSSRKFLVWLTQAIMSFSIIALCFVLIIIAKNWDVQIDTLSKLIETLFHLIELAMGYFVTISCVYLGVNFGQKMGFTFSDALKKVVTEEDTKIVLNKDEAN